MPYAAAAGATVEYRCTGSGRPVTVIGHGLGGTIDQARALAGGVAGTRALLHFRGHGRSTSPAGGAAVTYADLAADLLAVADAVSATRALGVSMGAGALLRAVLGAPERFARLAFFLPSVLDRPRPPAARRVLARLLAAVDAGDEAALRAAVIAELPAAVREHPGAPAYVAQRVATLRTPGVTAVLRSLPGQLAVPDVAALAAVRVPALVVAVRGDPVHPLATAQRLAAALPGSVLHVYPRPEAAWSDRADLTARIGGFLSAAD